MENNYDVYLNYLQKNLDKKRFYHSINVAKESYKLAEKYGYNKDKAYLSGLLHDVCKNESEEKMLKMFKEFGIILDDIQKSQYKLWHAVLGARFIQQEFSIEDKEIIDAIRYHTTGRANMTKLDKILYLADFISADRDFDGVDYLREFAYFNLDTAVFECLKFSINELCSMSKPIHTDTLDGYNHLLIKKMRLNNCTLLL